MRLGTNELLLILLIVLIIWGPKQIPKLTKMFKKSSEELKKAVEEDEDPTQET